MNIYNYGFDYDFGNNDMPFLEGLAGFLLVFLLFFCLIVVAFAVLAYILRAIGLQNIAKRRGIHHSWLAWIPVGSAWLMGSISDQYRYVAKGSVKNRRSQLMGLEIALLGVTGLVSMAQAAGGLYGILEQSGPVGIMAGLTTLLSLASTAVSVVYSVFYFIALHDLYASCDPGKKVIFLVLSILFNVTEPFFVFFNRTKDLGMPPRKQPEPVILPPVYPSAPMSETPVEETVSETVAQVVAEAPEVPQEAEIPVEAEAPATPVEPKVIAMPEAPAIPEEPKEAE